MVQLKECTNMHAQYAQVPQTRIACLFVFGNYSIVRAMFPPSAGSKCLIQVQLPAGFEDGGLPFLG